MSRTARPATFADAGATARHRPGPARPGGSTLRSAIASSCRSACLLELLAQHLGESIQFAPAGGDPLPLLHPPRPPAFSRCADLLTDRRRGPVVGAAEPGIPPEPDLPDDLHHGHRPPTATSTQRAIHARPVTCDFTMHTAQWRSGQTVRSDAYTRDQFISL